MDNTMMKNKFSIVILVFSCLSVMSCGKWLDISPKIEMSTDEAFSTEEGIKDALSGVYVMLKDQSLYGQNLSYGYIENMASLWEVATATTDESFNTHRYNMVTPQIDNMYGKLYNAIVNVNNILQNIETNRDVLKSKNLYEIVKGEGLALRAFLHFDLIRLFGPVPDRTDLGGAKLPYVTTVSSDINLPLPLEQYKAQLFKDLSEAQVYLKNDPILLYSAEALRSPTEFAKLKDLNEFFANRTIRMNYYASKALEARVALWFGEKELAYQSAMVVVNAVNTDGSKKFDIKKSSAAIIGKTDNLLVTEQLFGLFDYNLPTKYTQSFTSGMLFNGKTPDKIVKTMFGSTGTDIRELYLWEKRDFTAGVTKFITTKYNATSLSRQIPLIRLSEVYFIAIECAPTRAEVQPLWDSYRASRYILPKALPTSEALLRTELLAETRKEFYAEGQLFYMYKRYNAHKNDILFASTLLTVNYILPLPKTEIIN